jgi:limonene-1,2-epoxide hydrolase
MTEIRTDPVREFIRAFNERDVEAFVATLDPEVELHSMKGLLKGTEAARLWATRKRGGVQQRIDLEQLYEGGTEGGGGHAVALIMRRWHWDDDEGEFAGEDEMAWVFELRERRIRSWRPFEDREEALRRAGFTPS